MTWKLIMHDKGHGLPANDDYGKFWRLLDSDQLTIAQQYGDTYDRVTIYRALDGTRYKDERWPSVTGYFTYTYIEVTP